MTARELIEELSKLDPEVKVFTLDSEYGLEDVTELNLVYMKQRMYPKTYSSKNSEGAEPIIIID